MPRRSRGMGRVAIAALWVLLAACGEAAPVTSPPSEAPSSAAASTQTQEYRASTVVLANDEHGPQLCYAVAASYPPQCGGPDIVNWDWDAVDNEESANGVTWAEATVTGTWDGERFTLTRPVEPASAREWSEAPTDTTDSTPGCDEPDVVDPSADRRAAEGAIAALDRSTTSAIWVSDPGTEWDGPFVLTVVVPPGSAADTEAQIRKRYAGHLCVVERDQPTIAELNALQDEVFAVLENDGGGVRVDTPLGPVVGAGVDQRRGVLEIEVLVADDRARTFARERWGDAVELVGMLQPVDARP